MRKITHIEAQRIIDIACREWKQTLFEKWGKAIVLKDRIEITDDFYKQMRHACSVSQNKVFDEIFGKDNPFRFKVGDWIIDNAGKYPAFQVSRVGDGLYEFKGGQYGCALYSDDFCRAATDEEIAKAKYKEGDHIFIGRETHIWNSIVKVIRVEGGRCYAINKQGKEDYVSITCIERHATKEEIDALKYIPKGTPCLGIYSHNGAWYLAYSNGDGSFICGSSRRTIFERVIPLNMTALPVYDETKD